MDDLSSIRTALAPVLAEAASLEPARIISLQELGSDSIIRTLVGVGLGPMSVDDEHFFGES